MLRGLGLDLTVLSWIEGFLLGRTMRVSVSGSMSMSRDVTSGCRDVMPLSIYEDF